MPLKSGLRDESTYKVNFRVEYSDLLAPFFGEERDFDAEYAASTWLAKSPELLEQCEEENSFEPVLRRFTVLIAVEEIVNAHPYDSAAYEAFQDLLVVTPPQ